MRPRASIDRLSALDLTQLYSERPGVPFHVAVLAPLDATELSPPELLDRIRALVADRLPAVPRLRQRMSRPHFGGGRPYWVDDPDFDLRDHIRSCAVDPPGGEQALIATCLRLDTQLLDQARPLWELWLLVDPADGSMALYCKLHHVIADGLAALVVFAGLLDPADPDAGPARSAARRTATDPWPAPPPDRGTLIRDNARRRLDDLGRVLAGVVHPVRTARRATTYVRAMAYDIGRGPHPATSFNRPVGPARSLCLMRMPLDALRTAAHDRAVTINDLLLAATANGTRRLLEHRHERVDGGVLRVSMPVSTRAAGDELGNLITTMAIPIDVEQPDVEVAVRRIGAYTSERKRLGRVAGYSLFASDLVPDWALRRLTTYFADTHQRLIHLFVTDIPGPTSPLHLAGVALADAFPLTPIAGNAPISVAALSYDGRLNVAIHADPVLCPDLDVLAGGVAEAFTVLDVPVRRTAAVASTHQPAR